MFLKWSELCANGWGWSRLLALTLRGNWGGVEESLVSSPNKQTSSTAQFVAFLYNGFRCFFWSFDFFRDAYLGRKT